MASNIYATLQGLLQTSAGTQALQLAHDQFPGPVQTAISDYLNGITLQLGSEATLKVDPSTRQLELQALVGTASIDLQATASGATLTLASTKYSGAQVVLTFSDVDGGVALTLDATMGNSLQWPLQAAWPQLLDWTPANQAALANGQLHLTYGSGNLDFVGQGSLAYGSQTFADAELRVQYEGGQTGVLVGVVVPQWSPGSLWPALSALTFSNSGLVVSTVAGKSTSLSSLGLLDVKSVPALGADFDIAPGFLFFTSLKLTDSLAAIAGFMGNVSQLDLFAAYAQGTGATTVKAVLNDSFSAMNNGIFQFDGFTLEWSDPAQGNSSISATAAGTFHPDAGTAIDLSLTGSIIPAEGDLNLTVSLTNWAKPFGLETLTIVELDGGVTIGAEAAGVTLSADGDLKLQNPNAPQYEFEVGFEVEVVDFEVPNGIAVWTKADQAPMTLSNVLEAAFALDFSPATLQAQGEPEVADVVAFLDEVISITQFTFWFVEGAQLKKIGDRGPFPAGFGLQAQFTLLGQENVLVSATLAEQANPKAGFSGYVILQQPVSWGSVFMLSGWDPTAQKPTSQGPELAIAATPAGIVVPGVNNSQPVRFYSSMYLKFLDVVEDHLYALATTDNQFQLDYAVQEGTPAAGCGTWSGDSITFLLNPSQYQLGASFGFNFGWQNLTWDGITLWGVTLVPKVALPNFSVAAGLAFQASKQSLVVNGYFDFELLGLSLALGSQASPVSLVNVNVQGIIDSLKDVAGHVLDTVKQEASALMQAALADLNAFLAWAKSQWKNLVDGLKLVGQILQNQFKQLGKDLAQLLQGLGAAAAYVQQAMVALGYKLEEVAGWLSDLFGCPISKAAGSLP
ncbi:hypothetical protein [Azospirillum largimobile]